MTPPFRADHVGSLLRPHELHEARARERKGEIDAAALKAVQDRCIKEVIALQESIGIQAITDGEFRRDWWHIDFLHGFETTMLVYSMGQRQRNEGRLEVLTGIMKLA